MMELKVILAVGLTMGLTACGGGNSHMPSSLSSLNKPGKVVHIPKATPSFEGVKIGKPYRIMGKWYHPKPDPDYVEEGIASWYGPGFHGKLTANGEHYDQYAMTAAHTTLPLPSIVRVTNLDNGRALNVRLNDRGPFHHGRIIDLSHAAAKKLDVLKTGTARVRVEFLQAETERYFAQKGKQGFDIAYAENFAAYLPRELKIAHQQARQPLKKAKGLFEEAMKTSIQTNPQPPREQNTPVHLAKVEVAELPNLSPRIVTASNRVVKQPLSAKPRPWLVQVASYADTVNAENMLRKIRHLGNPWIKQVAVQGRSFYRVLLEPASHDINSLDMLAKLRHHFGIHDAKIIQP